MTTTAIEIPFLRRDVKVQVWKKTYKAATALLEDAQKKSLFPIYAGKHADEGEKEMIELCCEKETIDQVLDEFEILRDGEPPLLTLVKRYYELTPTRGNYKSLFFELLHAGQLAKLTYLSISLRYLQPRGQKFYEERKGDFVAEKQR